MSDSPTAIAHRQPSNGHRHMRAYEYRHMVSFEETNLVGNVYYVNHLRWQGRCREMFLYDHGIDVLKDFAEGLAIVTVRVACDYISELVAFDKLVIRMKLGGIVQNRITLLFEYFRETEAGDVLVAKGEQQVACMRRAGDRLEPTPIPEQLRDALRLYAE